MKLTYDEATELYYILCAIAEEMVEMGDDEENPERYELLGVLIDKARDAKYE